MPYEFFPSISLNSLNEEARLNFGVDYFKFDLNTRIVVCHSLFNTQDVVNDEYMEIENQPTATKDIFNLVHDYFIHYGYVKTLDQFEDESDYDIIL